MANYNVDIEVALKGAQDLRQFNKSLRDTTKLVGKINSRIIATGKANKITYKVASIENYRKAVDRALRTVNKAALGTKAHRSAVKNLVRAKKQLQDATDQQKKLFDGYADSLGLVTRKTNAATNATNRLAGAQKKVQGPASPIKGAANIPGSPLNLQAQAKRRGAAVTAGAFPLLFGGGPLQALGGAAGGLATGNMFGGATVGLQVVGGALDRAIGAFINQTNALATSLGSPTQALDALENAGFKVSGSIKRSVEELVEAGKSYEAQRIVLEEINRAIGPGAVGQLQAYKNETERLQEQYGELKAALVAELIPAVTGALSVINEVVIAFRALADSPVGQFVGKANKNILRKVMPGFGVAEDLFRGAQRRGRVLGKAAGAPSLDFDLQEADRIKKLKEEQKQREFMQKSEKKHQQEMMRLERDRARARKKALKDQYRALEDQLSLQIREIEFEQQQLRETIAKLQQKQDLEIDIQLSTIESIKINDQLLALDTDELGKLQNKRDQINAIFDIEKSILEVRKSQELGQAKSIENANLINQKYIMLLGNLEAQRDLMLGLNQVEQNRLLVDLFSQETLEKMFTAEQSIDELIKKYPMLGEASAAAAEMMTFGLSSFVEGTKTAEEVFADFLRSIADMLMSTAQQMIAQYIALGVARAFGLGTKIPSFQSGISAGLPLFGDYSGLNPGANFGGFGGGRANGGSVLAGKSYLVGERGPELFVPGAQGNIVSNDAMGGANVTVNVDASGSQVQGDGNNANQLGRAIGAAVQAELIKQQRPGGLLAR